ncbi:MAG: flagellar export chaperone FliS [Planctomycetes bacterium]|nr:flagellar export chaperone FliS [Planctomycetota bacterium]
MALPYARNQYLKTQIETASKEQLVVMLFDGIIRFTELARTAMREKRIEDTHHLLMRAQAIVMELICTVDKEAGGEVAANMMSLHAYAFNCLIVANLKKDEGKIDEVQKIYRELREAWTGAMGVLGLTGKDEGSADAPAKPLPAATGKAVAAAGAKPTAAPASPTPLSAAAAPAIPLASGYGMGKTAAFASTLPAPSAEAAGQRPLANGYAAGTRSIA